MRKDPSGCNWSAWANPAPSVAVVPGGFGGLPAIKPLGPALLVAHAWRIRYHGQFRYEEGVRVGHTERPFVLVPRDNSPQERQPSFVNKIEQGRFTCQHIDETGLIIAVGLALLTLPALLPVDTRLTRGQPINRETALLVGFAVVEIVNVQAHRVVWLPAHIGENQFVGQRTARDTKGSLDAAPGLNSHVMRFCQLPQGRLGVTPVVEHNHSCVSIGRRRTRSRRPDRSSRAGNTWSGIPCRR